MAKRLRVGRSSVAAVVVGVVLAAGCGGSSETKDKDGAAGGTGDGTAGSGGSNAGGGSKASGGKSGTGGKDGGGTSASGGIGQAGGGQEQAGGSGAESGGASAGGGTGSDTGGASPGTGGTTLPEPEVGTVGTECSEPGALQCAGTHQRVVVICGGDGQWEAFETCPVGQYCDTRPGETLGSCQEPHPDCVEREPGETMCQGNDVYACGVDTITVELVEQCPEYCGEGQCTSLASCPTGDNWVNCSRGCPEKGFDCQEHTTGEPRYTGTLVSIDIIRTPAAADAISCENGRRFFNVTRDEPLGVPSNEAVKFTVPPPWSLTLDGIEMCTTPAGATCAIAPGGVGSARRQVLVFADDQNAPAVNMTVELFPQGHTASCP